MKVGGSLYSHPNLGPGLRAYLAALDTPKVIVVPGGGGFADAVRDLDRVHRLGDEAAHWLALRSLSAAALFLRTLLPADGVAVLDSYEFARDDEGRPGALPHTWAVTTDSIAVRVAVAEHASRLILLKSVAIPPGTPWAGAAANGWVDGYFPSAVAGLAMPVEVVNFLERLG